MNVAQMTCEQVDAEIARRKGWTIIERGFGLTPIMPRATQDWRRAGELLEEMWNDPLLYSYAGAAMLIEQDTTVLTEGIARAWLAWDDERKEQYEDNA